MMEYVKAEAETIVFTAANASCTYRGTNNGHGDHGGNDGNNEGVGNN